MNPVPLPSPGLHYGVPFEDYAAWPAVNFSKLKPIRKTASKCKYEMDHPKQPTPAMVLGSSLHVATLEPARFDGMFFIRPECDRRTKEGKEIYAKAMAEANGRMMLEDGDEVGLVRGMAQSIRNSIAARPFLSAPGQNEVSAVWHDEETGLTCKARFDRFIPDFAPWKSPVIVEIKSDHDAEDWAFSKTILNRGYHIQAASYRHGLSRIIGKIAAHVFIVPENLPPHDIKVYMLGDNSLQTGLLEYRRMLKLFAECQTFDCWPGYKDEVEIIELPKWANETN